MTVFVSAEITYAPFLAKNLPCIVYSNLSNHNDTEITVVLERKAPGVVNRVAAAEGIWNVLREQAIDAAVDWLRSHGHEIGELRFACYAWDHCSGDLLWGGHYTRGLITVPTLGRLLDPTNPIPEPPLIYRLVQGWVVVFDPLDRVPEAPKDCFAVWVPEPEGKVRGGCPGRCTSSSRCLSQVDAGARLPEGTRPSRPHCAAGRRTRITPARKIRIE